MDEINPADVQILDLLRKREALTVSELAAAMDVTATAVRQRLVRLSSGGYLERSAEKGGRGRPSHRYSLTSKGRRKTGENFADLAIALWQEIRAIKDPQVRRGLMERVAARLAKLYASQVSGETIRQRMQRVAEMMHGRRVPFTVDESGGLPVLTALACPYPDIAEADRGICAVERQLFSELVGVPVRLSACRLDGDSCCTFETSKGACAN